MVVGKGLVGLNLMRSIEEVNDDGQVLWISSGEEAVSTHHFLNPDLIFMDVIQEGMSGIECARSIREQNKNVRIVLVSERFNQEFLTAAREIDLNGYLIRTNDTNFLREVILNMDKGKFILFMR